MALEDRFVVVVSQRVDSYKEREERRDALDQRLCYWLLEAGFIPYPIPNALNSSGKSDALLNWLTYLNPRAILLSGGNDIGLAEDRDNTERFLLNYARKQSLPVLGICRGMQMMAVCEGVVLKLLSGHTKTTHKLINYDKFSVWPNEVNSYHNWGIFDLPKNFKLMAKTEDNTIEAIRHVQLPWEGWMWHPEREKNFSLIDIERVRRLFKG
ncbi:gamma-glutamyl-gamma-aminobutyrate hydrolase [Leptospira alexanderi]|uniref:Peptidase C26 n=1 Tax=Leptospira alexanderi serovar Manhao 3 str. L 60 TaxID=1049759 RepID=V6I616_9LEPT|nr:gamma-glutamyl-gamma-aminobutyrate hydrolase [Leptospira alexanderi]EQA61234.1 peptidase C26 [Leptospira alexanderi serovar Manhao 3 str. L 60]